MNEWQTKTLGEVLLKTETTNPADEPEEEFEYIDVSSVSNLTYAVEATQRLLGKDAPSRARKLVRTGDVLFATIRPTLRRIAVVPAALNGQVCSTGYFLLRATSEIDQKFLFYSLFTPAFMDAMETLQKGASYPAVTDAEVKAQLISYPPLLEQQRIVAVLDEAFEGIATAKANAEKNLQSARELFRSRLESVFQQRSQTWTRSPLSALGTTQTGSTPRTTEPDHLGDEMPFVKPGDFNVDGSLNYANDGLSSLGVQRARIVRANSVLMVCIGATIGKTGFVENDIATNQQINAFTPTLGLSAKFIYFQMITADFQSRVLLSSGQATLPIINKSKWSALTVLVAPTLNEQLKIVDLLDALQEQSMRLAAVYQAKLSALDELKKSLLYEAFSGKL